MKKQTLVNLVLITVLIASVIGMWNNSQIQIFVVVSENVTCLSHSSFEPIDNYAVSYQNESTKGDFGVRYSFKVLGVKISGNYLIETYEYEGEKWTQFGGNLVFGTAGHIC